MEGNNIHWETFWHQPVSINHFVKGETPSLTPDFSLHLYPEIGKNLVTGMHPEKVGE